MPCFSVGRVFFAFFEVNDPCTALNASLLLVRFCFKRSGHLFQYRKLYVSGELPVNVVSAFSWPIP
jgi:hypothetical protein